MRTVCYIRKDSLPDFTSESDPKVPGATDAAVTAWMGKQGWRSAPGRLHLDPDGGFYIWQEQGPKPGGTHALWVSETMVRRLSAERIVEALDREDVADEIRVSLKIRIEERGDEYRVSVVSRSSGEWKRLDD